MSELRNWLKAANAKVAPLFAADSARIAETHVVGRHQRRLLRRHPGMEAAVIEEVEAGLARSDWHGLLYLMGWGADLGAFVPLYVGKAARRGVKHDLSANLVKLRGDKSKFARWGDGSAYHIGDLSQVLFGWRAYKAPSEKYERWAEMLFAERDLPRLRETVHLVLVPWRDSSRAPSGSWVTIEQAEAELIDLAIAEFEQTVLNVAGEVWWAPAAALVRPPDAYRSLRPVLWVDDAGELAGIAKELTREPLIGLDVETDLWTQRMCLVQIATPTRTLVIDPLAVDTRPLGPVLCMPQPVKVIHNAAFERRALGEVGLEILGVFDTLVQSRARRGRQVPGGHGLAAVCKRELGYVLDKSQQRSTWTRRPLSAEQLAYAAIDAEVLIDLHGALADSKQPALL